MHNNPNFLRNPNPNQRDSVPQTSQNPSNRPTLEEKYYEIFQESQIKDSTARFALDSLFPASTIGQSNEDMQRESYLYNRDSYMSQQPRETAINTQTLDNPFFAANTRKSVNMGYSEDISAKESYPIFIPKLQEPQQQQIIVHKEGPKSTGIEHVTNTNAAINQRAALPSNATSTVFFEQNQVANNNPVEYHYNTAYSEQPNLIYLPKPSTTSGVYYEPPRVEEMPSYVPHQKIYQPEPQQHFEYVYVKTPPPQVHQQYVTTATPPPQVHQQYVTTTMAPMPVPMQNHPRAEDNIKRSAAPIHQQVVKYQYDPSIVANQQYVNPNYEHIQVAYEPKPTLVYEPKPTVTYVTRESYPGVVNANYAFEPKQSYYNVHEEPQQYYHLSEPNIYPNQQQQIYYQHRESNPYPQPMPEIHYASPAMMNQAIPYHPQFQGMPPQVMPQPQYAMNTPAFQAYPNQPVQVQFELLPPQATPSQQMITTNLTPPPQAFQQQVVQQQAVHHQQEVPQQTTTTAQISQQQIVEKQEPQPQANSVQQPLPQEQKEPQVLSQEQKEPQVLSQEQTLPHQNPEQNFAVLPQQEVLEKKIVSPEEQSSKNEEQKPQPKIIEVQESTSVKHQNQATEKQTVIELSIPQTMEQKPQVASSQPSQQAEIQEPSSQISNTKDKQAESNHSQTTEQVSIQLAIPTPNQIFKAEFSEPTLSIPHKVTVHHDQEHEKQAKAGGKSHNNTSETQQENANKNQSQLPTQQKNEIAQNGIRSFV